MNHADHTPPRRATGLLHRVCDPRWLEEIEGDLAEQFALLVRTEGLTKARLVYWRDVLLFIANADLRTHRTRHYDQARGPIMLKSYFKIAVRNLRRHKAYASINVLGLAVGMACCLLTLLFVQDELRYDRFHEKADRVYRVNGVSENPEGAFYRTRMPPPVAPALEADYPEVEGVTRLTAVQRRSLFRVDEAVYYEDRVYLADRAFFEVFTLPLLQGDPTTALTIPGTVLLTETTARKYFGEANPLRQVITYENSVALTVAGVIADVPSNSHLRFDMLVALETPGIGRAGWLQNWGQSVANTYVLLRPDASVEALEAKLPGFIETYMQDDLDDDETYTLSLQALTAIHLYPHQPPEQVWAASTLKYVYIFSIIGVLMLLIACINYVNLATARAAGRAREVGVRKVLGSNRKQLVGQFLGESSVLTLMALGVAVLLVLLCLPVFNALTDKALAAAHLIDPMILLSLFGLWAFVGLAAGSYPAFSLSAARPAVVIKGGWVDGSRRRTHLRNSLVVVQFAAAMVLIVGTMVVSEQLDFMRHKDLGYETEQIVVVPLRDQAIWQNASSLRDEWLQLPNVEEVSYSSAVPNAVGRHSTARWEGAAEDEALEIYHVMVDYDFMEIFGFELTAGRSFSSAFPGDATAAYVLNEAAVKAIGWEEPIGKMFTLWDREAPVIGVVKDFHFASLHQPIGPMAFHFGPQWYRMASVKIQRTDVAETLAGLETALQRVAPDRPLDYTFFDASFDRFYRTEEHFSQLSAYFTFLALFLACLGLLGLTAFVIEQRTKEIGIRKVLGASVFSIVVLLTGRFLRLITLAFVLAAPIAYVAANRWLEDFAFRIDIPWWIFLLAGAAALGIALLTISYQSTRAALADPVETLRYE